MNANRQTTVIKGNNQESKMKITASNLIRWAGLAAMGAGVLFIAIQAIHPFDVLSSVTKLVPDRGSLQFRQTGAK